MEKIPAHEVIKEYEVIHQVIVFIVSTKGESTVYTIALLKIVIHEQLSAFGANVHRNRLIYWPKTPRASGRLY